MCGKEFRPISIRNKFCSLDCNTEFDMLRHRSIKKICPVCGKKFTTTIKARKNYCSKECRMLPHFKTKCQICGNIFMAFKPKNKYCSKVCQQKGYKNDHLNQQTKPRTFSCPNCGKTFTKMMTDKAYQNGLNGHNQTFPKFCGIFCRNHYYIDQKNKTNITCKVCGKNFHAAQSSKRKYCSDECARIGQIRGKTKGTRFQEFIVEKHPELLIEYEEWRGLRCSKCGIVLNSSNCKTLGKPHKANWCNDCTKKYQRTRRADNHGETYEMPSLWERRRRRK